uniref:EF-hand domain-containing protein n=1 Tax=viral metagenome TaxID=1070528 RepID=A0A6C0M0P1_9ZZZZ
MISKISNFLPSNKISGMMNLGSMDNRKNKTLIFGIIAILLIFLFFFVYWYRQIQRTNRLNPVFISKGKNATKKMIIPGIKLPQASNGYDLSLTFWIYINSWKYRKGSWKHVLHKGVDNSTHFSNPGVWIKPNQNDLRIQITTRMRGTKKNNLYTIKDINLRKWTQIGIIVQTNTIDLYVDGKIKRSENLYGLPVLNNGNMIVNNWSGFDGQISSISYSPKALNPSEMNNLHVLGPHRESKLKRVAKKVLNPIKKAIGIDDKDSDGKTGSGSCGPLSKIPKGNSKLIKKKEDELGKATRALKNAKQKKDAIMKKLANMKRKQSLNRENTINKSFNKMDSNRNRNISYKEFKNYKLN